MQLSVVVCAYTLERLDRTKRALASVLAGERRPDEILLVLDGDEELERQLRDGLPPEVTVLANVGAGISDARNTALKFAHGEVTAFLDDDAWAEPGWLAALETAFTDDAVLGAGGLVLPDWEDPRRAWPAELHWLVGSTYTGHRSDAGPITRPIGANMAARTASLLEVGGFSSAFGPRSGVKISSNEELASFAALARHFGAGHVVYVPDAVVHHFAPAARCTLSYLVARSTVEGRSKADIAALFGATAMGADRDYARTVLVPGVLRHLARALRTRSARDLRGATALTLSGGAAALSYLRRRVAERRGAGPLVRRRS